MTDRVRILFCMSCLVGLMAFPALVVAQDATDDCASAPAVGEGSFGADTDTATDDGELPCGSQVATPDVHLIYIPTCSGLATATTCANTDPNYDSIVVIWDELADCAGIAAGTAGSLACADDSGCAATGFASEAIGTVDAGTPYYVTVSGWSGTGYPGTVDISCQAVAPIPNDDCADRIAIFDGDTGYTTIGSSTDGPSNCAGTFGSDIWYNYTASATGSLVITNCGMADYDSALAIYTTTNCPVQSGASVLLGCNDDGGGTCGLQSQLVVQVTAGEEYKIQVGGFNGAFGNGTLNLQVLPPPANDDCLDRITVVDGNYAFSTLGASTDGPDPCGAIGSDIWYNWTATCDGNLVVSTCNQASYDTAIAAYDGTGCPVGTAGSAIGCNDDGGGCGLTSILTVPVSAGQDYKIQLGGFGGAQGFGTVSINCIIPPPPPPNDDCDDRIAIAGPLPVTVEGDATSATDDAITPCGLDDATPDVHYSHTPATTVLLNANTCNSSDVNVDTIVVLWDAGTTCPDVSGGTGTGTCNDDACGPGPGFASSVDAVTSAGTEYIITVAGWAGIGYGFSLQLQESAISIAEPCDFTNPGATEMTQSSSQAIVPGNSVSCNAGGITADNGYLRIFDFGLQGVTGTIEIKAVEIGIEVANAGAGFNTQPVNMIIHDHTGVYVPGGPILPGTIAPIGSQGFDLPTLAGPGIQCFEFDNPIVVDTSVLDDIAVEVDIPSAFNAGLPHVFFIGSNPDPETRQSYLRSVDCAVPDPLPTAGIGFPDMHIVMNIHYKPAVVGTEFLRGDADSNNVLNALVDALFLLAFGFQGGPPPPCMDEADVDGNGIVNALVDVLYLLGFGFQGGPPPPPPFPCDIGTEVVGCANPGC